MLAVATIEKKDGGGYDDEIIDEIDYEIDYDYENLAEVEGYAKPIISIYDLKSLSLKHVFVEPDKNWQKWGLRRFTKIRFLYDNVYLAALVVGGDGSDCAFYFYGWRNSTVETYIRVDGFVADVSLPINIISIPM